MTQRDSRCKVGGQAPARSRVQGVSVAARFALAAPLHELHLAVLGTGGDHVRQLCDALLPCLVAARLDRPRRITAHK